MALMPCRSFENCAPEESAITGYSSEGQDILVFVGLGYGPSYPPPLGWSFSNPGGFAICESATSQNSADSCAYNASVALAVSGWTPPGGVPGNSGVIADTDDFSNNLFTGDYSGISEFPVT